MPGRVESQSSVATFYIPSRKSVAIIGRSGSGKSTVLNLLMRFYDPQSGHILADSQNIQQVSLASLRSQMGVVFQDTFLLTSPSVRIFGWAKLAPPMLRSKQPPGMPAFMTPS